MVKMFKYHWRALVWVIIILLGCLLPGDEISTTASFLSKIIPKIEHFIGFEFDKLVHFCLYLVFTLLLLAGFTRQYSKMKVKAFFFSFLIAVCCGGIIELIQPLTGRSGDWNDMAANVSGVIAALILFGPTRWILRNIL